VIRWRALVAALAGILVSSAAWAGEPVAYIIEIHRGGGDIGVRSAAAGEWNAPQPLRPLRPGDQVRVTGDGRLVVLYHAGGAVQTISAANSPFTVPAAPPPSLTGTLRAAAAGLAEFFASKEGPPTYRKLAVRGAPRNAEPPTIVAPRDTRVFAGVLTFEWDGSDRLSYGIRVLGPEGGVWERRGLPHAPVVYPATAPPLRPGVRYTWQLGTPEFGAQRASFEIVTDVDAARIRQELDLVAPGDQDVVPRNTLVLMRATILYKEGLYDEARREVDAAIAADPDEPTLHRFLGYVYERMGASRRAVEAFERARALAPDS